jgi:hypothetical protein
LFTVLRAASDDTLRVVDSDGLEGLSNRFGVVAGPPSDGVITLPPADVAGSGGLILIKLYEALLDTLDDIPLLPRLLQLAGLLYLLNFGFTHLIKSQDRENLYQTWKKRWHDFTGRP